MDATALQRIALDVAAARSVDTVLRQLTDGLTAEPGVALARIWLVRPGDVCADCPMRAECPDQTSCLHLVASSGRSQVDPDERWDRLDGRFRRFPIGVRKVGRIAGSGRSEHMRVEADAPWISSPDWAAAEGLHCFAGQPLVFRGEVLGVLAVFSRRKISGEDFAWMRTFADQAAVAIANARAFEEVERLRAQLELERDYLREEYRIAQSFGGIVGESDVMQAMLRDIQRVAPTEASVLITGESGTGKELIASAIHEQSERSDKPMVRVNCASIPRDLFESEFFGHRKGAFTGATADRDGRFKVADGGTLFLDEVGEIPLELQGKLLRVLQEGQFSPVGSDRSTTVDVRVVCATNRDLQATVAEGGFREDLYYRLNVFPIAVPPLRDRQQDVPLLATHFLRSVTTRRNSSGLVLRKKDVAALMAYDWPGNVRELQNVIERAVILASADRLHIDLAPAPAPSAPVVPSAADAERGFLTEPERLEAMRRDVVAALARAGGKVSGEGGAADLLGIRPTTLASRMKSLGVERR